ncbi:MAG TPA: hypothetical protein VFE51_10780 [Verrucomicrobiae bacterium]|nr:hypothetical protein [Verrucomicrobiae bacterium]
MTKQGDLEGMREHWFRRTDAPSAANRASTVLLIPLLPVLAAFVQSCWIWFVRDTEHYQAMLHWLNYPELPTLLVLALQTGIAAAVVWPLRRLPSLQRGSAALLLVLFLAYDLFNNRQVVRW